MAFETDPNYAQALFGAVTSSGGGALPSGGQSRENNIVNNPLQIPNEDITRALMPQVQRAPIQLPSAFTTPNPQAGPAQMDNREVVGAGNARAQGIGNAVSATTRAVSTFINAKRNQEQRQNATKVARLIQFQQTKDQTEQQMDQMKATDPGYAQLKAANEQATKQRDSMLADPKFAKVVEKGFQISLTDPSQNKTEHHAAVQAGIDMFNKIRGKQQPQMNPQVAAQVGQRFQNQMPTQVGVNAQAQQRLQIEMAQQKEYLAYLGKLAPAQMRAMAAQQASSAADRRTQFVQGSENARKLADITANFTRDHQKFMDSKNLVMLKAGMAMKIADHNLTNSLGNPQKLLTEQNAYDQHQTALEVEQQKLIEQLTNDRDLYQKNNKHPNKGEAAVLDSKNKAIGAAVADLATLKEQHKIMMGTYMDARTGKVSLNGTTGGATDGSNQQSGASDGGSESGGSADAIMGGNVQDIFNNLFSGEDENTDDSK